jgi:hypothetical protein
MKSGWIEKILAGRVEARLKAEFRLLEPAEAKKLFTQDSYRQTTVNHLPQLSEKSSLYRAITKDLFQSRLVLLSQSPLAQGDKLEVVLHLPQYEIPLKLLAEAVGVETTKEMGRDLFHGELLFLSIHKGDVDQLAQSLIQSQFA